MDRAWVFLFASLLLTAIMLFDHEHTHQQIFREDGLEAKIELTPGTFGLGWQTRVTSVGTESDVARLANMQNEIVGYNIMPFLMLITAFLAAAVIGDD